ncbi:MAG TPA: hypothetical protein PKE47_11460 [Verrucomicrobiota bacterium]|nr:hypothetical protein [Verrucomicrobiota bacterium]
MLAFCFYRLAVEDRTPAKVAPKRTGPAPERLKIDGDWQAAVAKSLAKKRPAKGWPKPKS